MFNYHYNASQVTLMQAIDIECPLAKAIDFMSDTQQWLPWVLPQVEDMQPLPFGQWLLKMPNGLAKLRPRHSLVPGSLDYELITPGTGNWWVPVRMAPTPTGCHLAITFVKPEQVSISAFEAGMHSTTAGLCTLKLVLEQD